MWMPWRSFSTSRPRAQIASGDLAWPLDRGEDPERQVVVLGERLEQIVPVACPTLFHVDHHAPGERPDRPQDDIRTDLQPAPRPTVLRKAAAANVDQKVGPES